MKKSIFLCTNKIVSMLIIVFALAGCMLSQPDEGRGTQDHFKQRSIGETQLSIRGATARYVYGDNIARNKPIYASSEYSSSYAAGNANDGYTQTAWGTWCNNGAQYIFIDLMKNVELNTLVLRWNETNYATRYHIYISHDKKNWTRVYATDTGAGGIRELSNDLSIWTRYIGIYIIEGNTNLCMLQEFEIYKGKNLQTPTPTSTPTPTPTSSGDSPVEINGQLEVIGKQLCNQYGNPVQLRGMSTHGLQWYENCINEDSLDALAYDWQADLLRISLYVQEGGYESNPDYFTSLVDDVIGMVEARGMYALIDWHQLSPGDPWDNYDLAVEYFTYIAENHGHKPNIIYEICNEPNNVSWDGIRTYAEAIIPVIRAIDGDGVILVGTHGWGSLGISDGGDEWDIINNPVNASNIMYSFHFYAASHQDIYRDAFMNFAYYMPVFVTEWGAQYADGDGENDFESAALYLDFMRENKISWACWNFSDDFRSGAVFESGTAPNGPWWGTDPLKESGVWVRNRLRNRTY